ncbi:TRAP-type C4-dicarboxylate transport system permease small subunit [Paenalcaligenes hominis]|uniref:TRAP transporter small permease protein n=2 Tax=Paenalcaligenes hominis TaxID=643674 RepID=A0ABX0WPC5_9BURK|nr:TRAP transporter small permease [Paenalcaligenes hominis]NJB65127.1 TRAP-type C4-dicarboxylate transport system permease small subunit [Paenalcaligenes hominis]
MSSYGDHMDNDLIGMQLKRSQGGLIRLVETLLDALCATLLVLMTVITTVDVVGRYVLHAPVHGAYESNELLLGILVFAALPRVTWHQQHLAVTALGSALSPTLKRLQEKTLSLVSAVCLAVLSYFLWQHGTQLASYGDMSNALSLPLAPFAYAIAIFTAISAAAALVHVFLPTSAHP